MLNNRKKELLTLLGVFVVVVLLPLVVGDFVRYLIALIGVYCIAALGLNIFMGFCGQINMGTAAFFCIGAYVPTMLQIKFDVNYFLGAAIGVAFALLVAWIVSYPLLRLKGHAMAIGTLAFGMAVYLVAERFPDLTGGADGTSVPRMSLFGTELGEYFYYYMVVTVVLLVYLLCYFLIDSRIGRAWKAIRDDEDAAAAMGIDIDSYKQLAWITNSVIVAVAGALFAQQSGFLSPTNFALWTSIIVLVMITVGGLGTNLGSVVGATVMTLLPYILVMIQQYVLLVQGIILFLSLRFMPEGIVGTLPQLFRRFGWGQSGIGEGNENKEAAS